MSKTAQVQIELLSNEEIQVKFTQAQLRRFLAVFDQYQRQGQHATRQQYMDRVELEFRMDASISRLDLDQLDRYFQHKRW